MTSPLLIDAGGLAELLDVSVRTIRRMDQQGLLPAPVKLGGRAVRWRRDEIPAWIAAGCPDRIAWQAMSTTASGRRRVGGKP